MVFLVCLQCALNRNSEITVEGLRLGCHPLLCHSLDFLLPNTPAPVGVRPQRERSPPGPGEN